MHNTRQKIEARKLYTKLCGKGHCATLGKFIGGAFETKRPYEYGQWNYLFDLEGHTAKRIKEVVSALSKHEANNVYALLLLAQERTKYPMTAGYYPWQEIEAWLSSPNITMNTKNAVFIGIADSFKTLDTAIYADKIYQMFLSPSICADNPWTIDCAQKPGYQIIPYLEAAGMINGIAPTHTKDQYSYQEIVRKIRQEGKEIFKDSLERREYDRANKIDYAHGLFQWLFHKCPPEKFQDIITKYQEPRKISKHKNQQRRSDCATKIKE